MIKLFDLVADPTGLKYRYQCPDGHLIKGETAFKYAGIPNLSTMHNDCPVCEGERHEV